MTLGLLGLLVLPLALLLPCRPARAQGGGQWTGQIPTASGTYGAGTPWPAGGAFGSYFLDNSGEDTLNGSVGDVLEWEQEGDGSPPASQQSSLPVLVTVGVAGADSSYTGNYGSTFSLSDGFGDPTVARVPYGAEFPAIVVPNYLSGGVQSAGRHLVSAQVSQGGDGIWRATVSPTSVSGSATSPPTANLGECVGMFITFQADDRTISVECSNIEPSTYKPGSPLPPGTPLPTHTRGSDGSMQADSVVTWSSTLGEWLGESDLTASATNFASPSIGWQVSAPSDYLYGDSGLQENPGPNPIDLVGDFGTDNTANANSEFPQTVTYTATVTDSDGTTGAGTYTIKWHLPEDDWQQTNLVPATPQVFAAYDGPTSSGGQVHINVQQPQVDWSVPEQTAGGVLTGASIYVASLADVPVAAPVILGLQGYQLALSTAPPTPATYEETGTVGKFQQSVAEEIAIHSGNTSGIVIPGTDRMLPSLASTVSNSGDYADYFAGNNPAPAPHGSLTFTADEVQVYSQQNYQGDGYGTHGYTGPVTGHVVFPNNIVPVYFWTWTPAPQPGP